MPKLSSLFSMRYGHSLELNRLTRVAPPKGVNFVGRATGNNGVTARVEVPAGVVPGSEGELTVALGGQGGVMSTFVQPEPFLCGRDVAILSPRDATMTIVQKLWYAWCIYENHYRYSFGRQANRSLMELWLPDEIPAFVINGALPDLGADAASAMDSEIPLPQLKMWRRWKLKELFDIKKGKRLIERERKRGDTPFVATSTRDNGIVSYVSGDPMFPAGSISVPYNGQGGVGYAFYQPRAFSASDDVQVLLPPADADVAALLFVCAVLRHERYRYSFGRKWHLERMQETEILLPARDGRPNWKTMSRFMNGLPFSMGALGR